MVHLYLYHSSPCLCLVLYRAKFVLLNAFLFCSSGSSCSIVPIYCFSPVFLFIHLVTWFMFLRKVVFQGFSCDSMVVTIRFPLNAVFIFIKCCSSRLYCSRISMSWNEVLKGTVISFSSPEILRFILSCLSSLLKLLFSYNLPTLLRTKLVCFWEMLGENDEGRIYTCHIVDIDLFENYIYMH